jgi:prepilin-type N-terminal cleavage/methylation domain-containing protein
MNKLTNSYLGGGHYKKGFTLIELLAVIIILAIISLIATPITLNIVEESRKSAAKASANSYIKAIEYKASMSALEGNTYENKDDYVYDEISVDVSGTLPTGGIYSLKDQIVTSAVFCIDGYEISYSDSKTEVSGTCKGEDLKLNGSVKLSQTSGYYTYPESGTFEVIENLSGGALSCTSSDTSVADCSISGTTVTVTPVAYTGSATLTIKSESSSKYKEAQAAYVVTTEKGLLSYTANGYSGTYDGSNHGITVTSSGATIKYGIEEGNYTLDDSPKYTDVGEYTIYYQITKEGYNTVTGSKTVTIGPEASCFTYETNSTGITITNYTCGATTDDLSDGKYLDIIIPSTINGQTVTTIGYGAFSPFANAAATHISSVVIPDSVTTIESSAFEYNQLTSVTIPNSVTSIGGAAFKNNQLTSVTIPNSVTTIGGGAFYGNNLTSVTIPNSVTTIGRGAFYGNNLTSVTIPNSVTTIGREAFMNNQLTSIIIPNSVTTIGYSAFNNNQLPDNQAFIYKRNSDGSIDYTTLVSYGGSKRDNVTIPSGITTIGTYAFYENQLTSVVISEGVTTIESDAFWYNSLTSVSIPNSVTTIGSVAFGGNPVMTITIDNVNGAISGSPWGANKNSTIIYLR